MENFSQWSLPIYVEKRKNTAKTSGKNKTHRCFAQICRMQEKQKKKLRGYKFPLINFYFSFPKNFVGA